MVDIPGVQILSLWTLITATLLSVRSAFCVRLLRCRREFAFVEKKFCANSTMQRCAPLLFAGVLVCALPAPPCSRWPTPFAHSPWRLHVPGCARTPLQVAKLRHGAVAHRLRGGFDFPNYACSDPSWESEGPSEESESEREEEEDEEEGDEEDDVGDHGDLMDLSASPGGAQRAKPDAGPRKAESDSEGENLEDLLAKFIGEGGKEGSDSQDISEEW
jgi:hypothetical protein